MYIRSDTDFEATEEPLNMKAITWFTVKANLMETKKEAAERVEAIKKQIAMGILQPNGLPAGINPAMVGAPSQPKQHIRQQLIPNPMQKRLTPQQQWNQRFGIRR
jgi:hypothetical protein